MMDPTAKELLEMMSMKPIPEKNIEKIEKIIDRNCSFVDPWTNIQDKRIMKVFGKRAAEQGAISSYQQKVKQSAKRFCEFDAIDEMCPHSSSNWQSASSEAVKILNTEYQEPKKLILKKHCILRLTQNTSKLAQGIVCILSEVPEADDVSILVSIAPHVDAVMNPKRYEKKNDFLSWDKVRITKSAGFINYVLLIIVV